MKLLYNKKSQTATEYLIILAVVIVIALVVGNLLGGFPGISSGINENAARAALQAQSLSVTAYTVTPAKTMLRITNTMTNQIQLNDIHIDGRRCWLIGNHNQPHLQPILRTGQQIDIACGSYTAPSNSRYQAPITFTYTDLSTNAQYTIDENLFIVGRAAIFECPDGFVPVPGGFVLADGSTVPDFCVMKYEAKAQEISTGNIHPTGGADSALTLGNFRAVSVPEGRPWVNINWYDSIDRCRAMGDNYDLISDQQWMVMAESILNTPINDLNSSNTGGPNLARGHSDNSPSNSLAAILDSGVRNCDISVSLDHPNNVGCELKIEGYHGTDNNWNQPYRESSGSTGRDQLRTHILSNGEVLWDVAGNVYSWTGDIPETPTILVSGQYTNILDNNYALPYDNFVGIKWLKPSILLGVDYGFGSVVQLMGGSGCFAGLRGGYWTGGGSLFTFQCHDDNAPATSEIQQYGFRCTYTP
ncbi:MAG: hypothetical protein ACMXYK_02810 [Candidatus Woesearchaeota archaeon]